MTALPPGSRPALRRCSATRRNREVGRDHLGKLAPELTRLAGIGKQKDDAIDHAVALLEGQSAKQGLAVDRVQLGFHAVTPPIAADHRVPRPLVAGVWQRNLGRPTQAFVELRTQPAK